MDFLTRMNAAMDYIENHLTQEIDPAQVARQAGCSSYHFQRMFPFVTDVSLAEYIRRRRLTQAALDLQHTDMKVVDVAIKYGYASPVSFARAFAALHGITPREAQKAGAALKAYPRMSFQITIKGDKEMTYRIEAKEAFDVFGIETVASFSGSGNISPAALWQECHKNGKYEALLEAAGDLPDFLPKDLCKIHGIEHYRETKAGTFPYMLGAFVSKTSKTAGYQTVHIPAQTYAIFPSEPFRWDEDLFSILSDLHKRFYTEWLPTANYEKVDAANLEIYGGTPELGYLELWYPVQKIAGQL